MYNAEKFFEAIQSAGEKHLKCHELRSVLSLRDTFDREHSTSVIIGKIPKSLREDENIVWLDCFFNEELDDYITTFEYCE